MLGIEPAVKDFEHGEPTLAKGESAWLLFPAISGVALDADVHRGTDSGTFPCQCKTCAKRRKAVRRAAGLPAADYLRLHAGGQGLALRGFLRNAVIWPAICLNSPSFP